MKRKIITALILAAGICAKAQLNPMASMYLLNPCLGNPAMCGITEGWELNASFKAQWSNIDGGPLMGAATAGYRGRDKKVGLGISLYTEKAGVIQGSSAKATYAYHLPMDDMGNYLDLGLSLGVQGQSLDMKKARGDLQDQALYDFNRRGAYYDGDFGIAMRVGGLTVQGALPNLRRFFRKDGQGEGRGIIDRSTFMAGASYRFYLLGDLLNVIEPLAMYRATENYKPVLDFGIGTRMYEEKLLLNALYRTTGSLTIGAGTVYQSRLTIQVMHTSSTSKLDDYSNGEFEVAIRFMIR